MVNVIFKAIYLTRKSTPGLRLFSWNIPELWRINKGTFLSLIRVTICFHYFRKILQLLLTTCYESANDLGCLWKHTFLHKAGYKKGCSEDVYVCGYRKSLRKRMWVLERNWGASIYPQTIIYRDEWTFKDLNLFVFEVQTQKESSNVFWNSN